MKKWDKARIALHVAVISLVVSMGLLINSAFRKWDQYQYKELDYYLCDKRREVVIPEPPCIASCGIELYVGGWIEKGTVTISGLPSLKKGDLKFSSNSSRPYTRTVSHSYISEWYNKINIVFEPAKGSNCYIKIVYRHR